MMSAVLAIRLLLPERHAEVREERFRVLIGPRRRDDVDVHAADLVDLVVDDLGEDHLLLEPERVVPSAVESLPRHALEVAHARQRDLDERRDHRLLERHLDPRRDLARALRTPLRDGRALRRARALLRLSLRRGGGLVGLRLRRWLRRILGHDPYPLSIGSPHRLQMRTLRSSASSLIPIRTGRSQRPHTSNTFERWSAPSRSMMPP